MAACKKGVQAQQTISASAKLSAERICDKAASGDPAATREVLEELLAALSH